MAEAVRVYAPAKLNLCLSVGAIRPDGYHEVDTVLHVLELADEVRVSPSDRLSLECRPSVGVPDERNLAFRAALAFGEAVGRPPTVSIEITKRIPSGAGLGGGSSDAAAVIAALAEMSGLQRTDERCLHAARAIGADVPFFLYGAAALLSGRGDELVRTLEPLSCPVALIHPGTPVPTGAAYAAFDADPQPRPKCSRTVDALEARDVSALSAALANNLELGAARVVPDVAVALSWLREQPQAMAALLAGSGSTAFALTRSTADADAVCEAARARGWWASTSALGPVPLTISEAEVTE